jgi:hypothetical protein
MFPKGEIGVGVRLRRQPLSHNALPFREGLPGILWMSTSPVWRLLMSQRLIVERETPKSSATSLCSSCSPVHSSTSSPLSK